VYGSADLVLSSTSLGVGLSAVGFSTAVHAAVLLAPMGHPTGLRSADDDTLNVEVLISSPPAPETPEPEPAPTRPAGRSASWATHTHPYPVAPTHDWTPHDPNLVHLFAPSAPASVAPVLPADPASDDIPRFTIAIGAPAIGPYGVDSPHVASPSPDDDAPVPEQSVDGRAQFVSGSAPAYPDAARSDGVEGHVNLELVVGVSGSVESARLLHGVGHGLDEAALRAARQFRFAPATKGGRPVRVRMAWSLEFRLR
jgi:protein TonB